jgi:hypothetical protein
MYLEYEMNNTNNFIMRDQVHNLVPSIMDHERDFSVVRFMRQISIAVISVIGFRLFLF